MGNVYAFQHPSHQPTPENIGEGYGERSNDGRVHVHVVFDDGRVDASLDNPDDFADADTVGPDIFSLEHDESYDQGNPLGSLEVDPLVRFSILEMSRQRRRQQATRDCLGSAGVNAACARPRTARRLHVVADTEGE